jgi:DNA-binding transcriptional LysR family regulator
MKFTLKQMQIFLSVVNHGSTLAAAQDLNVSQPAVSAAISELESNLGTPLFDRWRKRIRLNDRGRMLVPSAQLLIANAREIESIFSGESAISGGTLRIGASMTFAGYIMPDVITSFLEQYPNTSVEMISSNRTNIISKIEDCSLDLGFIAGECHLPHIESLQCMTDELCIFAEADNPLAKKEEITVQDLIDAEWIVREPGSGTLETFLNALPPDFTHFKTKMVCDNLESIKKAVLKCSALACVSESVIREELKSGQLVRLNTPFINLKRNCYTLLHVQRKNSLILNTFFRHFTEIISGKTPAH